MCTGGRFFVVCILMLSWISFAASKKKISESQIRLKRGSEIGVVQKKVFTKKLRFEFTPAILGTVINDPFIKTYIYGVGVSAHLNDYFGIEGLYFLTNTDDNDLNRSLQNDYGKSVVAGRTKSFYSVNILWTPIYGKFALFSDYIIHMDTYFTVGYGTTKTHLASSGTKNIGIGQRYFVNKWLSFRFDLRNYLHNETRLTTKIEKKNLMILFGTSIFFPSRILK